MKLVLEIVSPIRMHRIQEMHTTKFLYVMGNRNVLLEHEIGIRII